MPVNQDEIKKPRLNIDDDALQGKFKGIRSRNKLASSTKKQSAISDNSITRKPNAIDVALGAMHANDENKVKDVSQKGSNSGLRVFPIGSYVMAAWKNNYEYLAEVLGHRKRFGASTEYKLRFVWDHIVEWYAHQKLREASKFEIDYVLNLCKSHGGPGCGRLLEGPQVAKSVSRQRQYSGASEISTSDLSVDNQNQIGKKSSAKGRKNSAGKMDNKAQSKLAADLNDDIMYDPTVARFSAACKRRRQLKQKGNEALENMLNTTPTCQSPTKKALASISGHLSPHHSPMSKSSLDLCASLSPKSTDTPDSVDLNIAANGINHSTESNGIPNSAGPLKNYPCPYCSRVLRNLKLFQAHMVNYHPDINESNEFEMRKRNFSTASDTNLSHSAQINDSSFSPNLERHRDNALASNNNKVVCPPAVQPFLSGFLKCGNCHQRYVSHKVEPKTLHIRCSVCFCWSHRQCVIKKQSTIPDRFVCDPCAQRVSLHILEQSSNVEASSELYDASGSLELSSFFLSTPPSTPPCHTKEKLDTPVAQSSSLTKRHLISELMSILNTMHQVKPLMDASRLQLKLIIPEMSDNSTTLPVQELKPLKRRFNDISSPSKDDLSSSKLSAIHADDKLNQILSAFEDMYSTSAASVYPDSNAYLQDLGAEILPELMPSCNESLPTEDLVNDLFCPTSASSFASFDTLGKGAQLLTPCKGNDVLCTPEKMQEDVSPPLKKMKLNTGIKPTDVQPETKHIVSDANNNSQQNYVPPVSRVASNLNGSSENSTELLIEAVAAQHFQGLETTSDDNNNCNQDHHHQLKYNLQSEDYDTACQLQPSPCKTGPHLAHSMMLFEKDSQSVNAVLDLVDERLKQLKSVVTSLESNARFLNARPDEHEQQSHQALLSLSTKNVNNNKREELGSSPASQNESVKILDTTYKSRCSLLRPLYKSGFSSDVDQASLESALSTCYSLLLARRDMVRKSN